MGAVWILALLLAGEAVALSDEEYYQMPRLFELEDYEECLALGGAYCRGSFQLAPRTNHHLMGLINQYTSDPYNFNRTRIHRGVCVTRSCASAGGERGAARALSARFAACVDERTRASYGLSARLLALDYCHGARPAPQPDAADWAFAGLALVLLAANVLGTAYDLLRSPDSKPKQFLEAWSVRANWARLTAAHEDGDPRLNALNPIHGVKAITLMFVMLAHSIIAYHTAYLHNPQFLETASRHPLATVLHNGSVIVQTFVVLSAFLLAYHLQLHAAARPAGELGLKLFFRVMLQRITRIAPAHLFVVGLAGTWWRLAGAGPQWALVAAESARCRRAWWTHALHLHNLLRPHQRCLLQTWFLAVDMQLYAVSAALWLALRRASRSPSRRANGAPRVLAALLATAVTATWAAAYAWDLRPILFLTFPETLRSLFVGEASFAWLYAAPWGSLPAALLGLLLAALLHRLQDDGVKLHDHPWAVAACRLAVPGLLLAIAAGAGAGALRGAGRGAGAWAVSLCAALDRPLFAALLAASLLGFFYRIDEAVWRLLSWRGWAVLARMSLAVLLLHWLFNYTQLALAPGPLHASVLDIGAHWLATMFLTYAASLPLHLLVEQPLYRCLRALC